MLKYGLISAADGVSFAEICEHVAALVQVNRALRKCKNKLLTEKVTVDMDGGTHIEVKANPLMTLKMNLITKGRTLYAEFGLTPSSRCRLQVPEGFKPPKDPDQEFLDGNAATG
jgi:P27 family predicted phage terminase small subunit